jgi:predicted naringenin-chalcone synthase
MNFCILGIGKAVPTQMITQNDAARLAVELAGMACSNGNAIHALYRKAGVQKRHSSLITTSTNGQPATQSFFPTAADSEDRGPTTASRMCRFESHALDLAAEAAGAAIKSSQTDSDDIAHLVTVSCTGFSAPGIDIGLIERLGLSREVARTHVGFMGCHGALNGLRVAAALGQSAPGSKVLLCCVELCSIHHQYAAGPQQIVANSLFSDGAAAIVGSYENHHSRPWQVVEQFSYLLPGTTDLMSWRIRDHGFEMQVSPLVPDVIRSTLGHWLVPRLAEHGLAFSDIRGWAIHPGGPRILTACADSLGFDYACLEPSQQVLAEFGNMSSPTVLFVLDRLRAEGDHSPCVALAFGPGVAIEAALLR